MSLIPFILDLADELHEFSRCLANGIDINDFGFGLYTGMDPHQSQPQQQQQQQNQQQQQQQQQQQPQTSPRRTRTSSLSSFWMPSKRHHPYNRIKTACCVKSGEGEGAVATPEKSDASSSSIGGTPGKSASYSVVNKNGFQVSMNVKQFAPNELSVKTIDNCIVVEGRHDDKEDGHGVISRHFVRKYMLPKGYDPNDVLSTLSSDGILTVKAPPPPPPTAKNDEPNERIIEIQPTPGPTPVLAVSAKDTPLKETTKKLVTAPSARLECQLPEKRQKLDVSPETESQPEESSPPATTHNENDSATAASEAGKESNDVEMEKTDEQIKPNEQQQQQQQKSDVAETEEIDVEKKMEIIEQATEKEEHEKEQEKLNAETEKQLLEENVTDSNGDAKNVCEKMDESCSNPPKTETKDKIEIAENKNEKIKENSGVTKMEVDDENEGHNDGGGNDEQDKNKKTDNTQVVGANNKTADIEMKTAVTAAAETDSAKTLTDSEKKTNNTDTSNNTNSSSSPDSNDKTTTNTTTILNNNTNASTNSSSSSTTTTTTTNNSTSNEISSKEDTKTADNGVVTGEIPEDVPKSNNSDANSAVAAAKTKTDKTETTDSKTECKEETENEIKTAVLNTDTTKTTTTTTNTTTIINKNKDIADEVALLKAATADPADITDTAEENVILTESIEGITATTETDSNTNTTTTATVENVECSLFAKKTHLGNGNNTTTATPIVATEEMAN